MKQTAYRLIKTLKHVFITRNFTILLCISGLSTEQMLLKDMKAASAGDLNLAVSVIYMTLEVSTVMTSFTWPLKASTISTACYVLSWMFLVDTAFNKNWFIQIFMQIYTDFDILPLTLYISWNFVIKNYSFFYYYYLKYVFKGFNYTPRKKYKNFWLHFILKCFWYGIYI